MARGPDHATHAPEPDSPHYGAPGPELYAIHVEECLEPCWSEWFGGLAVVPAEGGGTLLTGPVADQSALHGLLARVRDLNLTLVSVRRIGR